MVEYGSYAKEHGVVYAEMDVSPVNRVKYSAGATTYEEIFEGIWEGIVKAERWFGVVIRVRPSLVWGLEADDALECARVAVRYRNKGVVGLGIGGNESAATLEMVQDRALRLLLPGRAG